MFVLFFLVGQSQILANAGYNHSSKSGQLGWKPVRKVVGTHDVGQRVLIR